MAIFDGEMPAYLVMLAVKGGIADTALGSCSVPLIIRRSLGYEERLYLPRSIHLHQPPEVCLRDLDRCMPQELGHPIVVPVLAVLHPDLPRGHGGPIIQLEGARRVVTSSNDRWAASSRSPLPGLGLDSVALSACQVWTTTFSVRAVASFAIPKAATMSERG